MAASYRWDFPYTSRRAPVIARNVIATSQPLASQAGIQAFAEGGNAIDAILAAAITLTVVEPCNNGIGSDAFAQVWDGNQLHGYSGNGRSPAAWSPERFSIYEGMPRHGWDTVTVPGAVRTWRDLHEKFGELSFEDAFQSAIVYAREGFHVGHKTAALWQRSLDVFSEYDSFQSHFATAGGRAPKPGEVFKRPTLATTLEELALTKGESLYRGGYADRIVSQSERQGGCLSKSDLENHRGEWTSPIHIDYNNVRLHELPPSGQGLGALIALGILKHLETDTMNPGSSDWCHYQLEAMKIAIRASFDHISDPAHMADRVSVSELLDETSLKQAAMSIGSSASDLPPLALPTSEDTVYLAAADDSGMMVSYIQSNYMGFGSGIVIEDTGIAMQNRGAGFVLTPNHPNQVDGSKRPYHTIIPGFVTDQQNNPLAAFGVMGGHMQHQGHVQMVTRLFDHHENPQAASDAPRWHVTPDFEVVLESKESQQVVDELRARGHRARVGEDENLFGGAQLICRIDDGYIAASDHRKEGCALGL